ncbi:MAG: creatininase family protein [Chloroflexota bacterium]|nr:creatininase family protein [Chloroflexota bacterium]
MDKKIHWHLMSWQEIRDVREHNPVILIPAGTVETQGPYTYVGLECLVPQRLAEEVAHRTNALVLPTIPFGYSALFQDFPGTITLRPEVVSAVYEDVARSLIRHGFDHLLFLMMHLPNQPLMDHVANKVRDELGVLLAWINPGRLAPAIMREVSPNYTAARGHGADPGLSLAKYLEPEMVDLSRVVPNEAAQSFQGLPLEGGMTPTFENFPLNMALRLQDVSQESGGWGDPAYASEAQGEAIFKRMVDHVTALVKMFAGMQTRRAPS